MSGYMMPFLLHLIIALLNINQHSILVIYMKLQNQFSKTVICIYGVAGHGEEGEVYAFFTFINYVLLQCLLFK